jgi:hypothetical protein
MPYNHSIKAPITSGTTYTGRADGIFSLNEQALLKASGAWASPLAPPASPSSVTATYSFSTNQATITFSPPSVLNGSTITGYTVISSSGQTTTGASSPIVMSGLPIGPEYTFTVVASSTSGNSSASAQSNSMRTTVPVGQQAYTSNGTYTWYAPDGVSSVSVVVVGKGGDAVGVNGAGGGGVSWVDNYSVVPGQGYTVCVGSPDSYFGSASVVFAQSGKYYGGGGGAGAGGQAGTVYGYPTIGYTGGNGGGGSSAQLAGGGGGSAGGYAGGVDGGGWYHSNGFSVEGWRGVGTGGGGGPRNCTAAEYGGGGGGGGIGILGYIAGTATNIYGGFSYDRQYNPQTYSTGGSGGSGGEGGQAASYGRGGNGGGYGGGGGGSGGTGMTSGLGGPGAVRIIWPGNTRSFPSTSAGNM